MSIVTHINKVDLLIVGFYLAFRKKFVGTFILYTALLFLVTWFKNEIPQNEWGWVIYLLAVLMLSFIVTILVLFLGILLHIFGSASKLNAFQQEKVEISPEYLKVTFSESENTIKWAGVFMVRKTNAHTTYEYDRDTYIIVPKHDFPSAEQYEKFVATSLQHWNNAKAS